MNELDELLNEDQSLRKSLKEGKIPHKEFVEADTKVSKKFLGCLTCNQFSFDPENPEVYRAMVTLALHAPHEEMQEIFETARENIKPQDQAYFIDKLLIHDGKKQMYGTQYKKDEQGTVTFLPIEDENDVDERRRGMGLCSLRQYVEFMEGKRNSVDAD
jgi:hypothetical protein